MTAVFADTVYWIAIARPRDQWKSSALDARKALGDVLLVTTDEVLSEFLAAFSRSGPELRGAAARMARRILASPDVHVVPQSHAGFLRALDRYERRADKQYSLVDCVSMNVMEDHGIESALSIDHHFSQEGFRTLMTSSP